VPVLFPKDAAVICLHVTSHSCDWLVGLHADIYLFIYLFIIMNKPVTTNTGLNS